MCKSSSKYYFIIIIIISLYRKYLFFWKIYKKLFLFYSFGKTHFLILDADIIDSSLSHLEDPHNLQQKNMYEKKMSTLKKNIKMC